MSFLRTNGSVGFVVEMWVRKSWLFLIQDANGLKNRVRIWWIAACARCLPKQWKCLVSHKWTRFWYKAKHFGTIAARTNLQWTTIGPHSGDFTFLTCRTNDKIAFEKLGTPWSGQEVKWKCLIICGSSPAWKNSCQLQHIVKDKVTHARRNLTSFLMQLLGKKSRIFCNMKWQDFTCTWRNSKKLRNLRGSSRSF